MTVTGHLALGASSYLWAATLVPGHEIFNSGIIIWYVGLFITMFGALTPDLDHPSSTFGSRVKIISIPLSAIFGHRGITHSAFAVVGIAFAGYYFLGDVRYGDLTQYIPFLCIGYLSHLFADYISGGIPIFYPIKKKYGIYIVRNDVTEVLVYVLLFSFSIWAYFNRGEFIDLSSYGGFYGA